MGTSSSSPGPKRPPNLLPPWGENPLPPNPLPPDQEPQPDEGDQQPMDHVSPAFPTPWSVPKGAMTRFAHGSGSLGSVGRSYVNANSGAKHLATSARAGRQTTGTLAGFMANGIRNGFAEVAREIGLTNLVGRDVEYVLASFVNLLAPSGATVEQAIARDALNDTLWEVFEKYGVNTEGISALDNLERNDLVDVVGLYVSNYVNERLQQELFYRVERGTMDETEANNCAKQIKDFVFEVVRLDFQDIDPVSFDWQGTDGKNLIEQKYQNAYELLGGVE